MIETKEPSSSPSTSPFVHTYLPKDSLFVELSFYHISWPIPPLLLYTLKRKKTRRFTPIKRKVNTDIIFQQKHGRHFFHCLILIPLLILLLLLVSFLLLRKMSRLTSEEMQNLLNEMNTPACKTKQKFEYEKSREGVPDDLLAVEDKLSRLVSEYREQKLKLRNEKSFVVETQCRRLFIVSYYSKSVGSHIKTDIACFTTEQRAKNAIRAYEAERGPASDSGITIGFSIRDEDTLRVDKRLLSKLDKPLRQDF